MPLAMLELKGVNSSQGPQELSLNWLHSGAVAGQKQQKQQHQPSDILRFVWASKAQSCRCRHHFLEWSSQLHMETADWRAGDTDKQEGCRLPDSSEGCLSQRQGAAPHVVSRYTPVWLSTRFGPLISPYPRHHSPPFLPIILPFFVEDVTDALVVLTVDPAAKGVKVGD